VVVASEEVEVVLPAVDVVALAIAEALGVAAEEDLVIAEVAVDVVVPAEVVADAVEHEVAVKPSSSSLTDTWESSSLAARKMLSSHSIMPPERPFTVKSESLSTTKTSQPTVMPPTVMPPTELRPQPPRLSTECGIPSAPSWPPLSSAVSTKFTSHPDPKFFTWEPLREPVSRTFQTLLEL
jgi:hypothetical protein